MEFGTVTGSFRAFGHEVTLIALGIEIAPIVYFAEHQSFTRNVLGRLGWLDRIKLAVVDPECKLYLSVYAGS